VKHEETLLADMASEVELPGFDPDGSLYAMFFMLQHVSGSYANTAALQIQFQEGGAGEGPAILQLGGADKARASYVYLIDSAPFTYRVYNAPSRTVKVTIQLEKLGGEPLVLSIPGATVVE